MLIKYKYLENELKVFANKVVEDAKVNLQAEDKVASGSLLNSILVSNLVISQNSLEIGIRQNDYGGFIDKGVSGVNKKYSGTDYTYRDKMPPVKAIDKWLYDRGIAPRNVKGQFKSRSSVAFAIAKNIQLYGIKPTHYLTDAVNDNFKNMPEKLINAFALDTKATIDFIIKSNFKPNKK